jgi:N-hydroxyarylamine O-acetyltransferase
MDTDAYLDRIGFGADIRHDRYTLEALQRAHLTAVPFENLDVYHHRGVGVAPDHNVEKVVDHNRGGWCYELNGAFHALVEALGFDATLLGATVLPDDPTGRPQPDHATIEVLLDRPYLVDVGFGDSFIRPLPLDTEAASDGGTGYYRIVGDDDRTLQTREDGRWTDLYRFEHQATSHAAFEASNRYLQEDGNGWTDKPFATRLLDGGPDRVTLLSDRIKIRRSGAWEETAVSQERWAGELEHWFAMTP